MDYRNHLPQLDGGLFVSDGGLETTLIYKRGIDLDAFAVYPLLDDPRSTDAIRSYFEPFLTYAADGGHGFVLHTPTWRAGSAWGERLGHSEEDLHRYNHLGVELMIELRNHFSGGGAAVISGCVGPQADAYDPATRMSAEVAQAYHAPQVQTFAETEADMVTAMTLAYPEEAIGFVRAAEEVELPAVVSFTVETDGTLPGGMALGEAIGLVDRETTGAADYFMVNCAHPDHLDAVLREGGDWLERIQGLRCNASRRSHTELDESGALDEGDPDELAQLHAALAPVLPHVNILGGCCGTDHRHVEAICDAWLDAAGADSAALA